MERLHKALAIADLLGVNWRKYWPSQAWYGVRRFFKCLETKAYKMHIRVLLSRYRGWFTFQRPSATLEFLI